MSTNDQVGEGNEQKSPGGATGDAASESARPAKRRRGMPREFMSQLGKKTKGTFGRGRLKLDMILKPEHRDEYRALMNEPRRNATYLRDWLRERGYDIGLCAVRHHRRKFYDVAARVQESGFMAQAFANLARDCGEGVMAEATVVRSEQLLMQQFMDMAERQNLTGEQWTSLNKAIGAGIANRRQMQSLWRESEEAKRAAAEEARKLARGGASGRDVANRVRAILGMPLIDEDEDDQRHKYEKDEEAAEDRDPEAAQPGPAD